MRILDKEQVVLTLDSLGMRDGARERFEARLPPVLRRGARHRPDRLRQVHHALRGAQRDQLGREEHHHDRGPGRVPARRHQPDPGEPEGRPHLRHRACARCCAPTPTSSWSARSATPRRRKIAIESALTGHLVLSTLHTNDAPSAITRLTEMGIAPFLTASAVDCVVAQRLARRLCTYCKKRTVLTRRPALQAPASSTPPSTSRPTRPVGCARCGHSGYKGRVGLYEVMTRHRRDPRADHRARVGRRASARRPSSRACACCATTASRRCASGHLDRRGLTRHADAAVRSRPCR